MTRSVFTPDYERFRKLLVQSRKDRNVTQAELATYLGRPQSYVSKFERGERRLDIIELLEVLEALKIEPDEFIHRLTRVD